MAKGKNKITLRFWPYSFAIGLFIATIIAALMMFIAWDHNPQGEVHNETGIEWSYWMLIGGSWFISSLIISFISSIPIYFAINWFRNRAKKKAKGL